MNDDVSWSLFFATTEVEVVLGRGLTKHAAQPFPQRLTTREVADFFGVSLRTIPKLAG